ncbi:uncharacterized protein E0L32_001000 [Thyridium curvatum]|uniref:Uncharacterized protein n=1 Tax=Thyridium curvatum TaxID=1093900 RepID=A0A507AMT2_9PEZI|nr:uncharacterized protein E0L32_001000 [Thyridium curvatum]TPX11182.1 hypothetical protein E0L32_001000 [Thyridium curvatum]
MEKRPPQMLISKSTNQPSRAPQPVQLPQDPPAEQPLSSSSPSPSPSTASSPHPRRRRPVGAARRLVRRRQRRRRQELDPLRDGHGREPPPVPARPRVVVRAVRAVPVRVARVPRRPDVREVAPRRARAVEPAPVHDRAPAAAAAAARPRPRVDEGRGALRDGARVARAVVERRRRRRQRACCRGREPRRLLLLLLPLLLLPVRRGDGGGGAGAGVARVRRPRALVAARAGDDKRRGALVDADDRARVAVEHGVRQALERPLVDVEERDDARGVGRRRRRRRRRRAHADARRDGRDGRRVPAGRRLRVCRRRRGVGLGDVLRVGQHRRRVAASLMDGGEEEEAQEGERAMHGGGTEAMPARYRGQSHGLLRDSATMSLDDDLFRITDQEGSQVEE